MNNQNPKTTPITAQNESADAQPYYHSHKAQKARRLLQIVLSKKLVETKNR